MSMWGFVFEFSPHITWAIGTLLVQEVADVSISMMRCLELGVDYKSAGATSSTRAFPLPDLLLK